MKLHLVCIAVLFSFLTCSRSDVGERLFEITYPPIEFIIPAGQPAFRTFVIAQDRLPTGFDAALDDNGLTADDVDLVGGVRARLVSLSGEDFREIERIELRLCSASERDCTLFDLLFSVDDLGGRRQQVVNLNPGERNFRELFLADDVVRFELVITPFDFTSQNIDVRLEWGVAAARL